MMLAPAWKDWTVKKSSERLFLHRLGVRALEDGRMDRIHVHGLSQPDVICYLPPGLLLQKPGEWPDLIRRWKKDAAPKQAENLKKWLVANHYLPSDRSELDRRTSTSHSKHVELALPCIQTWWALA